MSKETRAARRAKKSTDKATKKSDALAAAAEIDANPLRKCQAVAASIGAKADTNERRARTITLFTTAATATIPLLIGLFGSHFVAGRVVPSVLAALTAIVATYAQIERPHERWVLYRRYQRILEAEVIKFRAHHAPFDKDDRDVVLGGLIAEYTVELQADWESLVPRSDELAALTKRAETR